MLRDIKGALKECRATKAEILGLIEEYRNAPREHVEDVIKAIMEGATQKIAVEVSDVCNEATALVQEEIYKRFDSLMDVLLGTDGGRRESSVPDMILAAKRKPKIDLDAVGHLADPIKREER